MSIGLKEGDGFVVAVAVALNEGLVDDSIAGFVVKLGRGEDLTNKLKTKLQGENKVGKGRCSYGLRELASPPARLVQLMTLSECWVMAVQKEPQKLMNGLKAEKRYHWLQAWKKKMDLR